MISMNLQTLRKRHGLSQEEVAGRIGVSRQAVAKWESGDTTPDLTNAMALAQLYDVSLDDLVNDPHEGLDIAPRGKYIFGIATVGERGQIVIPIKARKIFNISPGDELLFLGDVEQGLALVKQHFLLEMLEQSKKEENTCWK